jgi:hypothetical protein
MVSTYSKARRFFHGDNSSKFERGNFIYADWNGATIVALQSHKKRATAPLA